MKVGLALIRKEAEIYRSQGLHKEARDLYARFLACSAKIDPGAKSTIEKQIQFIELEMNRGDTGASKELSADQIDLIKKGWGASASECDLLVCAQTFMEIGRYADALKEFGNMIIKGTTLEPLSSPIADCFLQLFDSQTLPSNVERYAKALYRDKDRILTFQVSIADRLLNHGKLNHASAIYHHLCGIPSGSREIESRISALGAKMAALSAQQAAKPEIREAHVSASQHRSVFAPIGTALKSFILKVIAVFKFR